MALATRRHSSGLLLAEQATEEPQLRHALRRFDDQLRLLPPRAVFPGTATGYWRVVRMVADDRPALPVLTWMDATGAPIPLSTGILEELQRLRRDSRNQGPDVDERNAALEEQVRRERADAMEALHDEYEPYLERGRVGVSLAGVKKRPYWQRRFRGGER